MRGLRSPFLLEIIMNKVVLIGSGFSAHQVNDYDYKGNGWTIAVVNGGWKACPETFDYHIHPKDYLPYCPESYLPHQQHFPEYKESLDKFGGQKACGMSATLNVSYWILDNLKPDVLGFLGCDMNYTPKEDGSTHIYGVGNDIQQRGEADPDRMVRIYGKNNPNYLTDIYMRLAIEAEKYNGCKVVNLSTDPDTRLPYDKARPEDF